MNSATFCTLAFLAYRCSTALQDALGASVSSDMKWVRDATETDSERSVGNRRAEAVLDGVHESYIDCHAHRNHRMSLLIDDAQAGSPTRASPSTLTGLGSIRLCLRPRSSMSTTEPVVPATAMVSLLAVLARGRLTALGSLSC